jgi:hypothetical protein
VSADGGRLVKNAIALIKSDLEWPAMVGSQRRMGGLVIDIYVEFLYRFVVSLSKRRASANRPKVGAEVTSSQCRRAGYGCAVAEIYYKYRANVELHTGIHEKGFIFHNSGENYASDFDLGRAISIRVNPEDPSTSILHEEDHSE